MLNFGFYEIFYQKNLFLVIYPSLAYMQNESEKMGTWRRIMVFTPWFMIFLASTTPRRSRSVKLALYTEKSIFTIWKIDFHYFLGENRYPGIRASIDMISRNNFRIILLSFMCVYIPHI